jgi:uncharacterized protein YraI
MQLRSTIMFATAAIATACLSIPASAASVATAMTPLNIRSGPGPQYSVVGAIPGRGQAIIIGCIQGSLWCQVSYNGRPGWVYSQYLMAQLSGRALAVAESLSSMPVVTYQAPPETVGTAVVTPEITGTLIAPPAAPPIALNPPPPVGGYVISHPITSVYLNGEVVEGVGLPENVALAPIPGYDYEYTYINNQPVLVEPATRRVEYIYR